jgi:GT2 family glycosyltransferase
MLDLAVIIVSWNVRELILEAIRTLRADLATSGLTARVYVVDNASADGTAEAIRAERWPDVTLIESPRNVGFGAGNNLALRTLGFEDRPTPNPKGPRAVFLLNPDTRTQPGAIRALYDALFSLPYAGMVGARLEYEDGSLQHSGFRFPGLTQIAFDLFPMPNRLRGRLYESGLNGRYPRHLYDGTEPFAVEHTLGAAMMFRREAIEATGIFDEQYFMYSEEIDWCMRVRRAGWEIYIVPTARIVHLEGRSTRQARPQSLIHLWTSRFRFYAKYYTPLRVLLAKGVAKVGILFRIRALRAAAQRGEIAPESRDALIAAYREVLRR